MKWRGIFLLGLSRLLFFFGNKKRRVGVEHRVLRGRGASDFPGVKGLLASRRR